MLPELTDTEARVIGCLMEKSVTTPDQYPLTLNALTNACNQKSSRNPVMSLEKGEVQHTVRGLEAKNLVLVNENFKSGVEKYTHRFCNTRYSEIHLDPAQFAIVCVMLLRGPRTPGELRTNSGRLHTFTDNAAVLAALDGLVDREGGPLVVKLPKTPGRKDSEYMHLLSGPVDLEAYAARSETRKASASPGRASLADLEQRLSALEQEVAALRNKLSGN